MEEYKFELVSDYKPSGDQPKAIEALVKKFPELDFRYYWANEDTGADSGMQLWEDGELLEKIRPYSLVYPYCWDSLAQMA